MILKPILWPQIFQHDFFYHVAIKDLLLSNKSVELPENVLISEGGK